MRKTTILSAVFIALMLAGVLPSVNNSVLATHVPGTFTARCNPDGGQGPGCENTIIRELATIATATDWDPEAAYDTGTSAIIGSYYEMPLEFNGNSTSSYAPSASIKSYSVTGANATDLFFTIAKGTHFYRIPSTDTNDPQHAQAGTLVDLGEVKAHDWANATLRWVGTCNFNGAAPVDSIFIYGAADFFAAGCTLSAWNTFVSRHPVTYDDTAGTFTIKFDGDLNVANGQQPYAGAIGLISNTWAAVYSENFEENILGCHSIERQVAESNSTCTPAEAMIPPFDLGGSGPYILANNMTTTTSFTLVKNPNFCQGDRTLYTICGGATVGAENPSLRHSQRPLRIVYNAVAIETTRLSDLLAGRTDTAGIGLPSNLATMLTGPGLATLKSNLKDEYRVYPSPTLTVDHVGMIYSRNHTIAMEPGSSAYFAFPNGTAGNTFTSQLEGKCEDGATPASNGCILRRAIMLAFNYTHFINDILLNLGVQLADFVPAPMLGNNAQAVADGYLKYIKQNQNLAITMLRSIGYAKNHPLHLTCGYNTESLVRTALCSDVLRTSLQALQTNNADHSGTNASFIFVTPVGYRAHDWAVRVLEREAFDTYMWGWVPDYVDPDNYMRPYYYGGNGSPTAGGTWISTVGFGACATPVGAQVCPSHYDNTTLDSQINAALTITSPSARATAYEIIQRDASRACSCYIPLDQELVRPIIIASVSGFSWRSENPGFLYPNRDFTKVLLPPPIPGTPVFPNIIPTIISVAAILGAATLLVRTRKAQKIFK